MRKNLTITGAAIAACGLVLAFSPAAQAQETEGGLDLGSLTDMLSSLSADPAGEEGGEGGETGGLDLGSLTEQLGTLSADPAGEECPEGEECETTGSSTGSISGEIEFYGPAS